MVHDFTTKSIAQPRLPAAGSSGGAVLQIDETRWLIAEGPFQRSARPPDDGVAFYVNDFWLSEAEPWRLPNSWRWEEQRSDLISANQGDSVPLNWQEPDFQSFANVFSETAKALERGFIRKAVIGAIETAPVPPAFCASLAARALSQRSSGLCWSYAFAEHGRGFAGATPECLFSLEGNRLQTMALAGTARPERLSAFQADPKEQREHDLVAEALAQKLSSLGEVRRGPREVMNLGEMIHFLTRFEAVFHPGASLDPTALISQLHPTPAVGTSPNTPEARALLRQWREQLRLPSHFGAPFGAIWPGGSLAVVAIRGVLWENDHLCLPSGCGVVEGSEATREWQELALKRLWVKHALRLA